MRTLYADPKCLGFLSMQLSLWMILQFFFCKFNLSSNSHNLCFNFEKLTTHPPSPTAALQKYISVGRIRIILFPIFDFKI